MQDEPKQINSETAVPGQQQLLQDTTNIATVIPTADPPAKDRDPELAESTETTQTKNGKKEPDFFNTGNKKSSLQDHFSKFIKAKKQDIKYRNYVAEQAMKNRKDSEYKDRLRQKFIETAKKYFGVPYGSKYWKEGEKHYNAPLYLDCCALLRQVIYDLREDFGF